MSGGFIEIERDNVIVLAEPAEKAENIDVKRCKRALKDVEEKLKKLDINDPEFAEQQARIRRANVRLTVAGEQQG